MTEHHQIPQGRLRRSLPVARLTARTAGEAVVAAMRSRVTGVETTERHVRTAERYAELLGRSKGALMKAGQLLSFASMGSAVPPELEAAFQNALGRLRADAPPMAPELAQTVLGEDLGDAVATFESFDWTPLAAASIGQVHAAQLRDGRRVAVKIQYPGVADAIRADLQNVELMATFMKLLFGISPPRLRLDPRAVAKEVEAKILEELDYRHEAASQREFATVYRGHPFIRIPEVVDGLSTGRVLTQDLAEGLGWDAAVGADQQLRDAWGEAVQRFAYGSVNNFRITNTDPHPGNYLFEEDGTVTFLDFGCVARVPPHMASAAQALTRAGIGGDVEGLWRAAVAAGIWTEDDPVTPAEAFARLVALAHGRPGDFQVATRDSRCHLDGAVIAKELLDGARRLVGPARQPFELVGVLEERDEAVADEVRGRLVAGRQQQEAHPDDLVGLERLPFRRVDHRADEVDAQVAAALGDDADQEEHRSWCSAPRTETLRGIPIPIASPYPGRRPATSALATARTSAWERASRGSRPQRPSSGSPDPWTLSKRGPGSIGERPPRRSGASPRSISAPEPRSMSAPVPGGRAR